MTEPAPVEPANRPRVRFLMIAFVVLAVAGLTIDLCTKYIAFDQLAHTFRANDASVIFDDRPAEIRFVPQVLHFKLTVNYGAVFGIGQGKRWFFIAVSIAAIAFLVYMARKADRVWLAGLMGIMLAGVLGNMYDRVIYGHVRDMLWLFPRQSWGDWFGFLPDSIARYEIFPWIFNLADVFLCTGVAVLLLVSLFSPEPNPKLKPAQDHA